MASFFRSDGNRALAGDRRRRRAARRRRFGLLGVERLERREVLAVAMGDFNADGLEDVATGVPEENTVEVSYGAASGSERTESWTQDSRKIRERLELGDQFGAALAAGDFDADGFDDLAIGAPGEDLKRRVDVGLVHVLYGSEDGLTHRQNSIWFQNKSGIEGQGEDGDMFGAALLTADFNADGFLDLDVSVPGDDTINRLFGSKKGLIKRGDELLPVGEGEATFAVDDAEVAEGDTGMTSAVFTVTRSGSLAAAASVEFATAGDTADEDADFVSAAGQLEFAAGVATQSVTVEVIGDVDAETDESFFVNLLNAVGATVGDGEAVGTILDDDGTTPPPEARLSVSDVQVTEGDEGTVDAVFRVSLLGLADEPVTVDFATANGTAIEEDDYTATSGQLSFSAGVDTMNVTVAVTGDEDQEDNETFFLNLSNAVGATIADGEGRATIRDDDSDVPPPPPPPPPDGELFHVQATVQTDDSGGSADDPAIWVHPSDPGRSLILGTNKSSLRVYDLAGNEVQVLNDGEMNNVDLRYNFPLGGQSVALAVASNRADDTMTFYQVNESAGQLENVGSIDPGISVYGIGMYHSAASGKFYAFVNSKNGVVQQWELFDDGSGQVDGTLVRSFDVGSQPEGVVADDELGLVYVGEENVGVWKYGAEPDDGDARTEVDRVGGGRLTADVEGLAIYYASGGAGYLLVSSQGSNRFAIYSRDGDNAFLGSFDIVSGEGLDAVTSTDGIDVANLPLGSAFPQGAFVAQDNDTNFKLVPWERIATGAEPDLLIDTSFDPRGDGGGTPPPPPPPTTPELSISDVQVTEGQSGEASAVLAVRLSAAADQSVTAHFAASAATAASGSDFAAASGDLTIEPGQTQTAITVLVLGDTEDESNETFNVDLSAAVGATIADGRGRVTIVDDDGPVVPPPDGEAVTFAVIGDYGGDSSDEADVANLVKSWDPDFVITVGDNNYPAGSAETIDANVGQYYQEFIGNYQGLFGEGSPENRFFPSLGNHDWQSDDAQPYLDYFTLPGNERYYEFVEGPVHFFAIDSDGHEPDGNSASSQQAQWLQERLAASTSPFQVVYFHHAPYSSGSHGNEEVMQWPFAEWGADAVLTGHDHDYERLTVDGLRYYVVGTGGRSLRSIGEPIPGSEFRFDDEFGAMLVTAQSDSLTFQFYSVADGGTLVDESVVTAGSG